MFDCYDVVVVGGGHAGCEAAVAASNLGARVLLITLNMQTIGQMSCNPAMGGVAKGQIVREIDALHGRSAIVTDHTAIQFRMLNRSKGPAMWSPRAQNDRMQFALQWRKSLEEIPLVDFWQDMVVGVLIKGDRAVGVRTRLGYEIPAKAVILTTGTFMNGIIHIGEKQFGGGRMGEAASKGITEQLIELGFEAGRMKTGTPPRIQRSMIYCERALTDRPCFAVVSKARDRDTALPSKIKSNALPNAIAPAMPSNTTIFPHISSTTASKRVKSITSISPAKSTAPPATKKPPAKGS